GGIFARFLGVEFGPPSFDPYIASGDPARLREPLQERPEPGLLFRVVRGCRHQHADAPHPFALLRARRNRPRGRAAKQRDERAAFHSITSSASASNLSGTSSPSAFAVLRLMTSSNLVGCMIGSSAGLSPLRIRPTKIPTWR